MLIIQSHEKESTRRSWRICGLLKETRAGTFLKNYFGAAVKNRGGDFIYINFKTGRLGGGGKSIDLTINLVSPYVCIHHTGFYPLACCTCCPVLDSQSWAFSLQTRSDPHMVDSMVHSYCLTGVQRGDPSTLNWELSVLRGQQANECTACEWYQDVFQSGSLQEPQLSWPRNGERGNGGGAPECHIQEREGADEHPWLNIAHAKASSWRAWEAIYESTGKVATACWLIWVRDSSQNGKRQSPSSASTWIHLILADPAQTAPSIVPGAQVTDVDILA